MKTLRYSQQIDNKTLFNRVGDTVRIFIPIDFIRPDYPPISKSSIWGSRPYSINSDIVAICIHMGILFNKRYKKGPTQESERTLYTYNEALSFGESDVINSENRQKFEEEHRLAGVVLTVMAKPPLDFYPSFQGFYITSQSMTSDSQVSIDVVDYHFITHFEELPEFTNDPSLAIKHHSPSDFDVTSEDAKFKFDYTPDFFPLDNIEFLLKDYDIMFFVNNADFTTSSYTLKFSRVGFCFLHNDQEMLCVSTKLSSKQIKFLSHTISIDGKEYGPISGFRLYPKHEAFLKV